MKAMILAAGSGKRLAQITQHIPKPLIEVGGDSLIGYQVNRLAAEGFKELVINVSYMADAIIDALGDGSERGVSITYSYEPEVGGLETGGGVYQALPLLGDDPFVVVSADIYTEFPYACLRDADVSHAHLVLVPNPEYHQQGDFALDDQQRIALSGEKFNYAGIGVYTRALFDGVSERRFSLSSRLMPAIEQHQVSGQFYEGAWFNVGTPSELASLTQYLSTEKCP